MTNEEYHKSKALSCSGFKQFIKSPAHYLQYVADKLRQDSTESTVAQNLGSYIHSMILEPETVAERYSVKPDGLSMATKDGKAWKEEQAGKIIVSYQDFITAENAKKSVDLNPMAARLLTGGIAEMSILWTDDETCLDLKCRPDYLNHELRTIIDIKTTTDSSPAGFKKSSWNLLYHIQASYYQRGVYAEFGEWFDFLFIAIEKDQPYLQVVIYSPDDDLKEKADNIVSEQLRYFADCQSKNEYPGYTSGIQILTAPDWA